MKFGGTFIAATVVAALAAGCSGDPAPKEPTSRPAPTVTATPPAMPEQAREDSPEGAAAFVAYWVDVFNYASQTGDVDVLRSLSDSKCGGCQDYVELFKSTYLSGGYFRGGEWRIGEIRLSERDGVTFATTTYSTEGAIYRESASTREFRDPAEEQQISMALDRESSWRVTQLGLGDVK